MITKKSKSINLVRTGVFAGLSGGVAEIVWIALYKNIAGGNAASVAQGVTETLFPNIQSTAIAVPLGIFIHMSIAVALGMAIAILVRSWLPQTEARLIEPVVVIGLLSAIWAVNFYLILPAVNPAFVTLVPYSVSLISKVLFGCAAALTLQFIDRPLKATGRNLKGVV